MTKIISELTDREAIRECLYRYARGADRLDADMPRSAYWLDVLDTHLEFRGNAEEFIAWADVIGSGRYLDTFERRGDEWRIAERLVMADWFRQYPDSADWSAGLMGQRIDIGQRCPEDPSYTMLSLK